MEFLLQELLNASLTEVGSILEENQQHLDSAFVQLLDQHLSEARKHRNFHKALRLLYLLAFVQTGYVKADRTDIERGIAHAEEALLLAQELRDRDTEGATYHVLGATYYDLGEYQTAIHFYQKSLAIAQELGKRREESIAYNNLGFTHCNIGDYEKAINYHKQSLAVTQDLKDRIEESLAYYGLGICYDNLGDVYGSLGDYQTAVHYYQEYLQVTQKLNNQKGKSYAYRMLGITYHFIGDYYVAIEYYQKSLHVAQELNHRNEECLDYLELGRNYYLIGDYYVAIEYYQKSLHVAQELNNRKAESEAYNGLGDTYHQDTKAYQTAYKKAEAYNGLGDAYNSLNKYLTAIEYYQQFLQIAQELNDRNDRKKKEIACLKLIRVYTILGQKKEAAKYHHKHLEITKELLQIARELNDRKAESEAYKSLGDTHNLLDEYLMAIEYYQQFLQIAQELNDRKKKEIACLKLIRVYTILGQKKEAAKYHHKHLEITKELLQIARELNDRKAESEAYKSLGDTHNSLDEYLTAIEYYQQFLQIARELNDRKAESEAYKSLGDTHNSLDEYLTAIEYYQQFLQVAQELNERTAEKQAYMSLGIIYFSLSELSTAIKYYQKFLQIAREPIDKCHIYNTLGSLYNLLGEYQKAIKYHKKHLQIAQEFNDLENELIANLSLAREYLALDDHHTSMEYYLYCLQVIEESEEYDLNLKARVYSEVGNSYTTLNKYQVAIKYHQKALEIAEKSEEHGLKEMCYSGLGLSYFALSDYQTAIDYYQKALQVDSIMGMPTPLTKMTPYSGLGIAYHSLGEHQTASQMYQSALDMAFLPASPSSKATLLFPQIALHTAQGLGNIAFTQGDWKSAIEAYEISVFATEHLRAVSLTDQRRQKVVEESFSVYANLIHAYVQVGEYGKAIETADRSRAKHLVDLMHSSDLYKDGNVPETVRQLLAEYEAIQQELDQRRQQDSPRDLGFMGRSPQFSVEVLAQQDQRNREKIIELEQRKQYLYEQIRQADPVLAGQIQVDPLSIQQMRQLLTSSTTALVNIHTTSTDTYIFILTQKGDPQVFTCTGQGGTNLQAWLEREWLLPYLNIKQSQSLQEAQQKRQAWIDKMPDFLQELAEKLQLSTLINEEVFQNIDELIIVPHLLLHFIPFAALPVNNGQTQYLGERFTLRIIPSARILDYCHQRSVTPHSQTINYHPLPLLSQPNLPSTMGTVEDATSDLPFASFLGDELAKLLNISSDRRLRQQQATPDEYRELLDQVQGIHHYHHASYQLENPLDSALALADGNRLTLGQLLTPSWQMPGMPNIFLAACETQVGEINLTDDIISLGAGFLIAGARNVISTLWSVDQLGTAVFCLLFYENVQQGMNRALALQTAQKQMREMSGREFNQRYGKRIKRYLKEQESALTDQHDQCEQQWQEASGDLKEKLEQEKMQLSQRIIQCRDNYGFVREREREEAPFSHPYYWSAFISQGLA